MSARGRRKRNPREVHRSLTLRHHRGESGPDVRALQKDLAYELRRRKLAWFAPKQDGHAGHQTFHAAQFLAWVLGLSRGRVRAIDNGHLSVATQRLLRNPSTRGDEARAAERHRHPAVRKIRREHKRKGPKRVQKMVREVDRLTQMPGYYRYGGNHVSPPPASGNYDCSSCVSRILYVADAIHETMSTVGLATWGQPGKGRYVTVYVRNGYSAHTIIEIMGRFAECGGYSNPRNGGGPTWFHPTASYLASFTTHRHPAGL